VQVEHVGRGRAGVPLRAEHAAVLQLQHEARVRRRVDARAEARAQVGERVGAHVAAGAVPLGARADVAGERDGDRRLRGERRRGEPEGQRA
jgi:hypothetical protein